MIFQRTWQHVIDGSKTATRRVIKPNYCVWGLEASDEYFSRTVDCNTDRAIYAVGQRVPVMPARGVSGVRKVADFEIATLWRQDVREISEADALKEGFANPLDFLRTWASMHDPQLEERMMMIWFEQATIPHYDDTAEAQKLLMTAFADRPRERYMAAVIEWQPESLVVYADAVARARDLLATKAG